MAFVQYRLATRERDNDSRWQLGEPFFVSGDYHDAARTFLANVEIALSRADLEIREIQVRSEDYLEFGYDGIVLAYAHLRGEDDAYIIQLSAHETEAS